MMKQKLSFTIIAIILAMGLFSTKHVNADENQNMNEEEVLNLVLNNGEVLDWLTNHTLENENIWGWDGYWAVNLFTYNSTAFYYLEIVVNDQTEQIISINYYLNEYRTWEQENILIEKARTFISESKYFSLFENSSESLDIWISSFNRIEINYWSLDYYMRGLLGYTQLSNGETNFNFITIWSDATFGNVSLNFDDALIKVENTTVFKNFKSNFSSYYHESRITQSLYFDTPYYQVSPGYVILVENFVYADYNYLEFTDGQFIETNYYNYNSDSSIIWMDSYRQIQTFINGSDGTIIHQNKNYLEPGSYADLVNLAIEDSEILELLSGMRKFEGNLYQFDRNIFRLYINSQFSVARIELNINATSGEITDKILFSPIPPTRTESEILGIAMQNNEIQNLVENSLDLEYWVFYDSQGTWRIEFYDKIMTDTYGYVEIDDIEGDIRYWNSKYDQNPKLTIDEVIYITLDTDLRQFHKDHPTARISMFYDWNLEWNIIVYDPIYVESFIKIVVDDYNNEIKGISDNSASISTTNSIDDIRSYLLTTDEYKDFANLEGDKYEYIYYDNQWRVFLENIDSENVESKFYLSIRDYSTLIINEATRYDEWNTWNDNRIWPGELTDMFEYRWGLERLDRIPYTLLSDKIDEYTPPTPTVPLSEKSTESTETLDLPGFTTRFSISMLILTTFVYRKSKSRKN